MRERRDPTDKSVVAGPLDATGMRRVDVDLAAGDSAAPRSDVWPAPSRPSIEPPPGSRPSIEPLRLTPSTNRPASLALERTLWAIASLTQAAQPGATDEGLVRVFVDALAVVAPDALVFVRLIDPDPRGTGGVLGFAYANGKLIEARRDALELSQESAAAFGVSEEAAHAAGTTLTKGSTSYFSLGDAEAINSTLDIPLVESGALFGIVSIERASLIATQESSAVIATLASLLGSGLRNARLEQAALFFREYLAQTLEHASAPIFVLDRSRVVRSANRAALVLLDVGRSELLGRDFTLLLAAAHRERALPVLAQAFSGRATSGLELDVLRKDTDAARVAWNVAPIYDADGDVNAIVVIGRDLTEVHHLEEQIVHADKLATLGQLAAGIVHELNNPLTSITVYGEYLHAKAQRTNAEAGDVEKLRRIVEGASRMTRFTRDLVTYARPTNEEEQALSIREVTLAGARFCEHVMNDANVTMTTDFDADLAPISGVRGQLHQVFVNLVTNASQAMAPRGGGNVHIEAHRATSATGDEIVVRVGDDGPGISAEHLPRIFEPFYSTKAEGTGTGLGLSIVRKIVKAHRGTIEVTTRQSETQSGTTFEIRFPAL